MKILNSPEIRTAEKLLQKHIPRSLKVYGNLFSISRSKGSTPWEVAVDAWPDFNVIVCCRQTKDKNAPHDADRVSFFCMDESILTKMLKDEELVDWSTFFMFSGVDQNYVPLVKEISSQRGTNFREVTRTHLLHLTDCDSLRSSDHSEIDSKVSSLNESHAELINATWKFGGDEHGYRIIKKMIGNFPSRCIVDDQGQPVSWILVYEYCAMGILYTLPSHRGKGYAKALVSSMARDLHAQGYPVYCFVEEENMLSYRLFKNLGFIEDPSFRATWCHCNF